ncbi:hypothetical protein [Sulfitobacter guttiformis]|uniref:Uncharacterized protein n=1 Tax=Sulfitobacter guttiformis TaxID=74349 RepID=A0A420DP81_9RHOB|nr:hypothetical protein [Sulfitobacter guttiformis]KIN73313.1 hypothetical protein Z949_2502 [Sulfitobacter guttiformis KCTC 32187]RKE95983.1 hypothetical protein C8N30_0533 [Sulfitobacter guttiformis]
MSGTKINFTDVNKLDRPSENLATIDTNNAPWYDGKGRHANDKAQHRRYHGLFEDLMN